nr:myb domain protein 62 [Tanacetum cinerariifolium]
VREYGLFDGTTWKKHPDFLKTDIISKCVENSTFNGKCKRSVDAIDSQLGNQHKNRQYRLHVIYNKFPTHEEALVDPPSGIELSDWVKLCEKFASEKFQMLSEQNKKNRSFNLIPPAVGTKSVARIIDMNKLRSEEADGSVGSQDPAIPQSVLAGYFDQRPWYIWPRPGSPAPPVISGQDPTISSLSRVARPGYSKSVLAGYSDQDPGISSQDPAISSS